MRCGDPGRLEEHKGLCMGFKKEKKRNKINIFPPREISETKGVFFVCVCGWWSKDLAADA